MAIKYAEPLTDNSYMHDMLISTVIRSMLAMMKICGVGMLTMKVKMYDNDKYSTSFTEDSVLANLPKKKKKKQSGLTPAAKPIVSKKKKVVKKKVKKNGSVRQRKSVS